MFENFMLLSEETLGFNQGRNLAKDLPYKPFSPEASIFEIIFIP